uniref:Cilia- and flagella-associated protein 157 n=1 Tax=Echinostoma caproni TaxID=27848 RepID=A0A183A499_9TREM
LLDERAALDQQRLRLMNEVAEERDRLNLTCAREREEIERGRQNLESRLEQLTAKYERELVQQRLEMTKRHEV